MSNSIYTCDRCGYETKQRYLLINHFNRKRTCDPLVSDVCVRELLDKLINADSDLKRYVCKNCGKRYADRQIKYQHQRKCKESRELVPVATTVEQLAGTVASLQKELAEIKAKGNTTINNGTINNTQNNNVHIHVTPRDFARGENTDYLDPQFLLECLRDMDLVKVLEELHFNPDHPENHNVRVKNVKKNLMEYTDGGKWVASKKDEVLEHLVMNGYRVLHTYYKDNRDDVEGELEDSEVDQSLRWLKRIYNEDKSVVKQLKEDAFLLVMNNKALLLQKPK